MSHSESNIHRLQKFVLPSMKPQKYICSESARTMRRLQCPIFNLTFTYSEFLWAFYCPIPKPNIYSDESSFSDQTKTQAYLSQINPDNQFQLHLSLGGGINGLPRYESVLVLEKATEPEPQGFGSPSRTAQELSKPPVPWWWNQWPSESNIHVIRMFVLLKVLGIELSFVFDSHTCVDMC
jgi:hypothetical protein